ncbi:hypothetical protein DFJ74DRAFT_721600 [Hyaloraphidium curvatum]|nr:hypothetical protein DFJ74DRAFT_721600 [Hyaloraphidium curvatum]
MGDVLQLDPLEWAVLAPTRAAHSAEGPLARLLPPDGADDSPPLPLSDADACAELAAAGEPLFARCIKASAMLHRRFALQARVLTWGPALAAVPVLVALAVFAARESVPGAPTFGPAQVGAGLAAVALFFLSNIVGFTLALRQRLFREWGITFRVLTPFAPAVRWLKLARASSSLGQTGEPTGDAALEAREDSKTAVAGPVLLQHDSDDPMCSCPRPSCARGVISADFRWRVADLVGFVASRWAIHILLLWTPLVTLAPVFWGTAWSAAFGGVACAFALLSDPVLGLGRSFGPIITASSASFASRMQQRAVSRALASLLDRYRAALASGGGQEPPSDPEGGDVGRELYVRLHLRLSVGWSGRFTHLGTFSRLLAARIAALVLGLILNIAAGSCVAAWQLAFLLFVLLFFFAEMAYVAEANRQLDGVVALYRAAQLSIRDLAALAGRRPAAQPTKDMLEQLSRHDALLSSFVEVRSLRARVAGFPVSYPLLRTLAATLFTVGVGIWSVLRGAGVALTVQTVCPAY